MAEGSNTEVFVYMGEGGPVVPDDVVHVRVHPSVTIIEDAFRGCNKLEEVELCDGLLEIGMNAFWKCEELKRISIPSTVTVINHYAFFECKQLEEIELCEGLLRIGKGSFEECIRLKRISVPSTVTVVQENAFSGCSDLEDVELRNGLQEIGNEAFFCVGPLKRLTIPDTVRSIGTLAFCHVWKLQYLQLPEGIDSMGSYTFSHNRCATCRIPPNLIRITSNFIGTCRSMFSLEFSLDVTDIEGDALQESHSLRNIAFPPNADVDEYAFDNKCTDLQQLFDTDEQLINALQHRFDNLPIHKMIYYQSYNNITSDQLNNATNSRCDQRRSLRSKLDPSGKSQDCLGMTPLHIMACSTAQNLELYKVIVDKYPENLVIKDGWGAVPLLYAVWGNAPDEIVQFLIESYKSIHPDRELNWTKLVEHLCLGNAATSSIQKLLDVQQTLFPEEHIDWHMIIQKATTRATPVVQADVFSFLVKCSFSKRIDAVGIKQWRDDLMIEIEKRMLIENGTIDRPKSYILSEDLPKRRCWFNGFTSKLSMYEAKYQELKEAMTMIELVLWKNKYSEASNSKQEVGSSKKMKFGESTITREQSRVSCGANIVIENVLPYLISVPADDSSSDMESDDDGSERNKV